MLASDALHTLLYGGSRSGKTALLIRAMCLRALKAAESRHCVLRYRFNHVKASVVHDTFPFVMKHCFPRVSYDLNKTDWFAELENGSQVWFGGLDDKDRTEKILGQEYATILFNECSQISYASLTMALTRLAQTVKFEHPTRGLENLALKAYYDCNPPSKAHWTCHLFIDHRDPETREALKNGHDYACLQMNPEDNAANLSKSYLEMLSNLPARMRRRFLMGEFADANPNALWTSEGIDKWRQLGELPDMQRVIVGVDPSGASSAEDAGHDEIGIVVAGLGTDGRAYVLEDLTLLGGPSTWGNVATTAYERHLADAVVAEINYGGAMVESVIKASNASVRYKPVTASRGKVVRAEPISALAEQGKIRMAGTFPELEDELCAFSTGGYTGERSPNRADAMIWAVTELFPAVVRQPKERKSVLRRPRAELVGAQGWMGA